MKTLGMFKGALIGLAILLATNASAANKGSMEVSSPVNVGGKQLSAGDYSLRWEGTGPTVQVSIMKDGKAMATTSAKVVPLARAYRLNSVVVNTHDDGSRSLSEVRFSGKKFALEIGGDSTSMSSSNTSN
jgi:uncharacterized protein YfaP (DUF2135 family)